MLTIQVPTSGTDTSKTLKTLALPPMLLPTITYGFAIIYSFGKQGLFTRLLGRQAFDIYGIWWPVDSAKCHLYALQSHRMLINNITWDTLDKKFMVVSRVMKDSAWGTFRETLLRPLAGTLAVSFIQCFFLCFTDFGIPPCHP
ncbi:MAG: hypothetical protein ACLTLQ_12720 [[Clostridium] scindens]